MTERGIELSEEDLAILRTMDQVLAAGTDLRLVAGGEDAGRTREYVELLGLLPYALAAETPAPGLRQRILTRVAAEAEPSALDDVPEPVARQLARTSPAVYAPAARPGWGTWATATAFAVVLLAAGFWGGVARERSVQIDRLNAAFTAAYQDRDVHAELVSTKRRLDMITQVAQQAYPMRTVDSNGAARAPEGTVWVCGMHQQWYLNLRGLEPPAEDEAYYLWFLTDDGAVNGGRIDVVADAPVELEAPTMPDGTYGFGVTLERGAEPPAAPGEMIVLGEKPISL